MSKKIKYLSISLVCLVTVCLSFILLNSIGVTFALSPDDVAYGATQEDLETINEKATETDVVEEIGTIQTYPDHYLDNLVYSDNQYIISGDNPIVKVVPRNNFYQSGFNVVIGRE